MIVFRCARRQAKCEMIFKWYARQGSGQVY
jgi:hypothetical protein